MDPKVFHAAKNGELKTLQDLHRRDARSVSKAVTFQGNNVIHIAAREGYLEIVTWMLGLNSCLALARNKTRNTPLHEAAESGNAEIVKVLIQRSQCSASKRNLHGETPLIIASDHGHLDAARLLLNAMPLFMVFWPREDRRTCLNAAVYGGHLDVVKLILTEKPSCFHVVRFMLLIGDRFGTTPLHVAVHGGHAEIVREIMSTKLKLCWGMECWDSSNLMTRKDNLGRCPVHIAAIKGHGDILDEFMTAMPDCVEIRSSSLQTPLHLAVENNQFDIVKKLLAENKVELNGKLVSHDYDMRGNTALHLAAMNGVNPQMVEHLLSFPNANVNAINNEGQTALDVAKSKLKDSQDKPNFGMITALFEGKGGSESEIGHPNPNNNSSPGWLSYKSQRQSGSQESKILDVDTLTASLIATMTFAAIFQVPGEVDSNTNIARWALRTLFKVFLFSDCLALFASLSVVIAWIFRERLQTKLVADRSMLAKLSMLSLGTSVVSTVLAFLSAAILVTIPRHIDSDVKNKKERHDYRMLLAGEILTAFVAPFLAIVFLSGAWLIEYYFKATNERQIRLKGELKKVLISTLPVAAIVLVILFTSVIRNMY